jgi:RNA polymerase sigma-70 factor (ECF subfamily)
LELDPDIRKTARGDHSAFGRIVEAYQGRIFAYLGRMGFDSATAEDIARDTFLRMWRNAGQFDRKLGGLATWILTIARNIGLRSEIRCEFWHAELALPVPATPRSA